MRSATDNGKPVQYECDAWGNHMAEHCPIRQPDQRRRSCVCFPPVIMSFLCCGFCVIAMSCMWFEKEAMAYENRALRAEWQQYRQAMAEQNVKSIGRLNTIEKRLPAPANRP
jgi:hypothetical protein